jgi:hypothetical protein
VSGRRPHAVVPRSQQNHGGRSPGDGIGHHIPPRRRRTGRSRSPARDSGARDAGSPPGDRRAPPAGGERRRRKAAPGPTVSPPHRDGRPRPGEPAVPRSVRTDSSGSRGAVRKLPRLPNYSFLAFCVSGPCFLKSPVCIYFGTPNRSALPAVSRWARPTGQGPAVRRSAGRRARVPRFNGPGSRGSIGSTGQGP